MDVVRRAQLDAVDRDDEVADVDLDARRLQRRAELGIPALGVVDARDLVAPALDDEVRAEEAAGLAGRRHFRHVAAAHVRVADRELGAHVVEQIVQVGAMVHVRQHLAVHLAHPVPVGAVEVRHVHVVALIAPAFEEDLLVLLARLEIHAQRDVEPPGIRLRRIAIGVDDEQGRPGGRAAATTAATSAAATTAGAVQHLVPVGAHRIRLRAGDERRRPARAQLIPMQRGAAATRRRLEVIDRAGDTRIAAASSRGPARPAPR